MEEEQRPQPTTAVETDVVYGVDEEFFPAEDIVRCFDNDNCEHLRGKPKLFFFQMCRGSRLTLFTFQHLALVLLIGCLLSKLCWNDVIFFMARNNDFTVCCRPGRPGCNN